MDFYLRLVYVTKFVAGLLLKLWVTYSVLLPRLPRGVGICIISTFGTECTNGFARTYFTSIMSLLTSW